MSMDALVRFAGVSKRYDDGTLAVDTVHLDIPPGEFCVLLGASGAGKSTLLRMVNGLVTPTTGQIHFDGVTLQKSTLRRIQMRVAMIHQSFHLAPRLSVLDNVLTGALPRISTFRALFHLFPREFVRKSCQLLEQVGLGEEHLYRRAMHLSGGQQQRVAIARAFLLDPPLVLADEPVASLDPSTSVAILSLLREASRQRGTAVLCSLHQVELARQFADRIVGMRGGRVIFDGTPEEFDADWQEAVYRRDEADAKHPDLLRTMGLEVAA